MPNAQLPPFSPEDVELLLAALDALRSVLQELRRSAEAPLARVQGDHSLDALGSADTPLRQWAEDVLYGSTDSDRWAALRYTTILGRYDIQITEGCLSISLSFDRDNVLQQIDLRVDAPATGETVSSS